MSEETPEYASKRMHRSYWLRNNFNEHPAIVALYAYANMLKKKEKSHD